MKGFIFIIVLLLIAGAPPAESSPGCAADEISELATGTVNGKIVTKFVCTKMLCEGSINREFCERLEGVVRAMKKVWRYNHHERIKEHHLNETVQI